MLSQLFFDLISGYFLMLAHNIARIAQVLQPRLLRQWAAMAYASVNVIPARIHV